MSDRTRDAAINVGDYDVMREMLKDSATHEQLETLMCVLYIPKMEIERHDICLVLKSIERERSWGQYAKR